MRSVADHQAVVSGLFRAPERAEVPVTDALGLVLAADIDAPIALPGFDNSAMDGYAVCAADVAAASATTPIRLPVAADIPAGRTDELTLDPGTAHRIMTGAPIPAGADAVIPVEAITTDDPLAHIEVTAPVAEGRHIRRAGSDIAVGERALTAGTSVGAPQIGLLAALGLDRVPVFRRLRVIVLSTGSELVSAGNPLRHGQIYESNGEMLTAAALEAGASARHEHFVPDDAAQFLARLDAVADDADLIITSGGVSAGAFEVVKDALSGPGSPDSPAVEFVKVAMQPGMPQGCGHITSPTGRAVPIVTLPGNPVSSLVSFEVFIRPPLRRAMGMPGDRRRVRARLTADVRSPDGKRQFLRGVLHTGTADTTGSDAAGGPALADEPQVEPIGPPASHHLRYLASANALIDIPADTTTVAAGETVAVTVL
ncbi:molybdopterin molybdotransferase MoeA [Gordonia sinesedis]